MHPTVNPGSSYPRNGPFVPADLFISLHLIQNHITDAHISRSGGLLPQTTFFVKTNWNAFLFHLNLIFTHRDQRLIKEHEHCLLLCFYHCFHFTRVEKSKIVILLRNTNSPIGNKIDSKRGKRNDPKKPKKRKKGQGSVFRFHLNRRLESPRPVVLFECDSK